MSRTTMNIHPESRFSQDPQGNLWRVMFTHVNDDIKNIDILTDNIEMTLFAGSLSIKEADDLAGSIEGTLYQLREWNNQRKADVNEELES